MAINRVAKIHKGQAHQFKSRSADLAYLSERGLEISPTHIVLEEYFRQRPALNAAIADATSHKDFEVLGTNMTTALCTLSATGGITLTTAGADADSSILLPHLDAGQSSWATTQWNTGKSIRFEKWIKTGANITAVTIWAGLKLTNTPVIATDDDSIFFRYQDTQNSGKWQFNTSRAGTDTTSNLSLAVAVSTLYRLVIEVSSDRTVRAFINNNEMFSAPLAAVTDNINLIPYSGILAGAAAAKAYDVKYLRMSRLAA